MSLQTEIRNELAEYGAGYDAHKDRLADTWDHAESVNKLLVLLNKVAESDCQKQIISMREALRDLIELHHSWERGTASVRRVFVDANDAAIAKARAALALS